MEGEGGSEQGRYDGHVMQSSAYTTATLHPVWVRITHWINAIAMDSRGNIYTGEVEQAKRIQKFVPVTGR